LWGVLTDLKQYNARDEIFEKYELSKSRLMSDERLPIALVTQIFAHCESMKIYEAGFLTGLSSEHGQLGVLDYFLASTHTLGEMILYLTRYFPIISTEKASLDLDKTLASHIVLRLRAKIDNSIGELLFYEMLLGITIRSIKVNSGKQQVLPEIIGFPYKKLTKSIATFLSERGIRIQLGAKEFQLTYAREMLESKLQFRDRVVVDLLKPTLENLLGKTQSNQSITSAVLGLFQKSTDISELILGNVAANLALSQSSLKRKLAEENNSFSNLLLRFKQSRAMELVTGSETKLSAIALMLGYADRSAFERAFKEWFGVTASQARQQYISSNLPDNAGDPVDLSDVPACPKLYQELLILLDSDDYSIDAISNLIEQDPALTGKLLGIANSAYYGFREITNISNAVRDLFGLVQTRHFVLSILSNSQFDTASSKEMDRQVYWTHATATYECIRILSNVMEFDGVIERDRYCLAALLHRLFELVYAGKRPTETDQYLCLLKDAELYIHSDDCQNIEKKLFGISGYQATAVLLAKWGIPVEVHKLIRELSDEKDKRSEKANILLYISDCFRYILYNQCDDAAKEQVLAELSELITLDYQAISQKVTSIDSRLNLISEQARLMC